jgi:anti-sigma-K factor RskA
MISETQEERASLFVLGLLPAAEAAQFLQEVESDRELQQLVASLNNATLALARDCPRIEPPPEVKARLLRSLAAQEKAQITPMPSVASARSGWFSRLALAAALIVGAFYGYEKYRHGQESTQWRETQVAINSQKQQTERKLAALENTVRQQQAQWEQEKKESLAKIASLTTEAASLRKTIEQLEKANQLDQARIAVLGSLIKERPQAVAVSVWNQQQQDGLLVVENLPKLAAGKDYQLWVIDPTIKAPVSAGVFKVDAEGKMRLKFKPEQPINDPGKFAVTVEKEGGVPQPTLSQLVVISK